MNVILTWKVDLVGIVIDLFKNFEWPISPWAQFPFSYLREPFFSEVNPNPIIEFEAHLSSPMILSLGYLGVDLVNALLYLGMDFHHFGCPLLCI